MDQNYSKYTNLSDEEIIKEINDKKKKILEYHNINKDLKIELTNILKKINLFYQKNNNQLNDNEFNLQNKLDIKKNDFIISKKYNSALKNQYMKLIDKSKDISENKIIDILSGHKLNIQKLQNENKEIQKEITKNESQKIQQQNKVTKIRYNDLKIKSISNYNEKLFKYMNIKTNFINKINNSNKIIKDNIQEFNKLENLIQSKNKTLSENEKLFNKINEEMSIIKSDLSGTIEEISKKCLNDDVLIYSIMNKNYNNINNDTNNSKNININEINRDIGDLNKNYNNNNMNTISSNVVLVKSPSMNNINQTNNLQNNKIRLNPIINRNNSQSFITDKIHQNDFYHLNNFNSNLKQINDLISENNKESENENNNNINKFKKISINNSNKSSLYHDDKRRMKEKIKLKNINSFSLDFSHVNYNKVDDEIYHKLLDRKKSFLAEKERIAFNIKEIQKNFSSKYNKVNICLKNNVVKLNNIKIINNNLQEEINKLQKLLKELENKNKQTEN